MAWTSPRTWVASEVVTAAIMNTHVRDNLKAIGDAWTAYTPTFTNLTVGNGTLSASYVQAGKWVTYRGSLIFGTTTAVTGSIIISLPANLLDAASGHPLGWATCRDVSAVLRIPTTAITLDVNDMSFITTAGANVNATVPFTWANTDELRWQITYEAA